MMDTVSINCFVLIHSRLHLIFHFETFCRTKKKALLDVFLKEYETVSCQPNLFSSLSYWGPRGAYFLLTIKPGGWPK